VIAPLLVMVALAGAPQPAAEVVTQIQVHGNLLTPEEEVLRLAEVRVGMPFESSTLETVAERLRSTHQFENVEVLKRFASIADPSQIVLVILVDDGRVAVDWSTGEVSRPKGILGGRGRRLMFLPLLGYEDGYGFSYGAQFAVPDAVGARSRLAFPLTWGGEKLAGVELEKNFTSGPFTRILGGGELSRRENPYFEQDDDRRRVTVRGERRFGRSLLLGMSTGFERATFAGVSESFGTIGGDVKIDTRLDPFLSPNAVYARASLERLGFETGGIARSSLEARGHVGLIGQNVLVLRAQREDSSRPLPPNFKPLLGGAANLRGFEAGHDVGDTLVAGSAELLVPLTSPLNVGKLGLSAFIDIATIYDKGERLSDQHFERGIGGAVWVAATIFRLELSVARGLGSETRVHLAAGVTF
jgi:outer membrane protein assembly factor BamA